MNIREKLKLGLRLGNFIAILSLIVAILSLIVALPSALTAIDDLRTKDAPPKIIVNLDNYYNTPEGKNEIVLMTLDVSATPNRFYVNKFETIIKVDGENSRFQSGLGLPLRVVESGKYKGDVNVSLPSKKRAGGHEISIDFWIVIKDLYTGKLYKMNMEHPFVFVTGIWQSDNEPKRMNFIEIIDQQ